jgi:cupin 2 domain-containing protein
MRVENLFAHDPIEPGTEATDEFLDTGRIRIERIVSSGYRSPEGFWYDQPEEEWVVLLKGEARIQIEEASELLELRAGDCIRLPAHQRHRVAWTTSEEPTIWLAVHYRR